MSGRGDKDLFIVAHELGRTDPANVWKHFLEEEVRRL